MIPGAPIRRGAREGRQRRGPGTGRRGARAWSGRPAFGAWDARGRGPGTGAPGSGPRRGHSHRHFRRSTPGASCRVVGVPRAGPSPDSFLVPARHRAPAACPSLGSARTRPDGRSASAACPWRRSAKNLEPASATIASEDVGRRRSAGCCASGLGARHDGQPPGTKREGPVTRALSEWLGQVPCRDCSLSAGCEPAPG